MNEINRGISSCAASGSTVTQGSSTQPLPFTTSQGVPDQENELVSATYWEIVRQWFFLGWTAFGGPSAHLAIFQKVELPLQIELG